MEEKNMDKEFKRSVNNMDIDSVEKKLFDERHQLVEFAEDNGQWQLFDDKQSIGSMRDSIERMEDSKLKQDIMKRFEKVEYLYNVYTRKIVEDSV